MMAKQGLDDTEIPGYFLPEESQLRLVRLSGYIKLLTRLMHSRAADGAREWSPEAGSGELAFGFELLADQVDLVLDELSWPAQRIDDTSAPERGNAVVAVSKPPASQLADLVFGFTVAQIDRLDHLVQTVAAHGDMLAVNGGADLAGRTLPAIGQSICEAAEAMRGVLDQVEQSQRLRPEIALRPGVADQRASYRVGTSVSVASAPVSLDTYRRSRRTASYGAGVRLQ